MVLTRAQAAAQAAALATIHDSEPVTAIVELPGESRASAMPPGNSDQLTYLAQQFMVQTHALAAQQSLLHHRQQGQNDAQSAALMAMQASGDENVKQLTDQQRLIAERFGEALTATHTELQEKFRHLQIKEDSRTAQIEQFVDGKLAEALHEVQ
ncbi:unnamed protein product [Phytophthora fragariaefolia]|uniref:Unnamed protein product n=1 Tax=Phytophthora fragariaefolia TaxID=1490495 RepID=A0A9W6WPL7_9STRA|nr:unnamed protein product [Phytophthora fragariaefolia]